MAVLDLEARIPKRRLDVNHHLRDQSHDQTNHSRHIDAGTCYHVQSGACLKLVAAGASFTDATENVSDKRPQPTIGKLSDKRPQPAVVKLSDERPQPLSGWRIEPPLFRRDAFDRRLDLPDRRTPVAARNNSRLRCCPKLTRRAGQSHLSRVRFAR
jgi:hypothetical protein